MKNILVIYFCLFIWNLTLAQPADSIAILNKAKLLTLHNYGVLPIDSLLSEVLNQETNVYVYSSFPNTIFYKIKYHQKRNLDQFGNCYFYISYNKLTNRYYRLGGFRELDIDSFFKDVYYTELINFDHHLNSTFDFGCLEAYFQAHIRKRKKMGTCYPTIDECAQYKIITYKKDLK